MHADTEGGSRVGAVDRAAEAAPIAAGSAAAGVERVQFVRSLTIETGGSAPDRLAAQLATYVGGATLFALTLFTTRVLGLSVRVMLPLVLGVPMIFFARGLGHRWTRRGLRVKHAASARDAPERTARIVCRGVPQELHRYGELIDTPFEPHACPTALAAPFPSWMNLVAAIFGIGLWGASCAILPPVPVSGLVFLWGSASVAVFAVAYTWPSYLRVVPGRLDVLRYFALRKRPIETRSFNLKTSHVKVDLHRKLIVIQGPRDFQVCYAWILGGESLAFHVLLGAISTARPTPLPDGELLG